MESDDLILKSSNEFFLTIPYFLEVLPVDLLMTLLDLFSMTKMNRSESFGIIPNIYEKIRYYESGDYGIISGDVII